MEWGPLASDFCSVFTDAVDKKQTNRKNQRSAANESNNTRPGCGQPAQDASSQSRQAGQMCSRLLPRPEPAGLSRAGTEHFDYVGEIKRGDERTAAERNHTITSRCFCTQRRQSCRQQLLHAHRKPSAHTFLNI